MEEKFADYLIKTYFKKDLTFAEALNYIKTVIENTVKSEYYDREGFMVEISDVREVTHKRTASCHSTVTIVLPKSANYKSDDFICWFKENGFTYNVLNYQYGWRIAM